MNVSNRHGHNIIFWLLSSTQGTGDSVTNAEPVMLTRPQPPKPRPKPRMSENVTAVI